MNCLDSLWSLTVAGSARAGLLILAVLVLRVVLRERVPAQCFHLLWLLVALRLFMPVGPGSAWSVFNLFSGAKAVDSRMTAPWQVRLGAETPVAEHVSTVVAEPVRAMSPSRRRLDPRQAIPFVWMFGILAQTVLLARSGMRMRRRLRGVPVVRDPRLSAMLAECAARFGMSGKLVVLETDMVSGPAVVGFWKPRLLFPPGLASRLSDEELRFVLLHECAHLRRRDLLALNTR